MKPKIKRSQSIVDEATLNMSRWYFDGGCVPNPGKMTSMVVDPAGKTHFLDLGEEGTNNIAEWFGLIRAMEMAIKYNNKEAVFFGDSKLVIQQALGLWRVKAEHLISYFLKSQILCEKFQRVTFQHVYREKNLAGIALERLGF